MKKIVLALIAVAVVIVTVRTYEYRTTTAFEQRVSSYADVLAPHMWNYDVEMATMAGHLAMKSEGWTQLALYHESGEILTTIEDKPSQPFSERILSSVGLDRTDEFAVDIRHNQQRIGRLRVVRTNTNYKVHLFIGLVFVVLATGTALTARELRRNKRIASLSQARLSQNAKLASQADKLVELNKALENNVSVEREVSRLKDEFLASLSHELRTPLNAVMGLSEALQEEVYGPLTEKQNDSLQTIWDSGNHLLSMFNDLLVFARVGARKHPTHLTQVNLRSSVRMVAERHTRQAAVKHLDIELDLRDSDLFVITDETHFQQIISNLLDNAIKFTNIGGSVGITVKEDASSNHIRVDVWDTGVGVPPSQQENMFDPFVQVEGGLSRRYGGTGLGLALISRLANLLGIDLEMTSTEGVGSTFSLLLQKGMPYRVEVYADIYCPSCYSLHVWLSEMNLLHLCHWRWVTSASNAGFTDEFINAAIQRVKKADPEMAIKPPLNLEGGPLTMSMLQSIETNEPWRSVEARRAIYEAVWRVGTDISTEEAIRGLLSAFKPATFEHKEEAVAQLAVNTDQWRKDGQGKLPLIRSITDGMTRHGLGQRSDLYEFMDAKLQSIDS